MTSDSRGAGGTVETITVAGQPAFSLRNSVGDQLVVLQHGAQVLSWMTADGIERMYCTPRLPSTPKPVRGGVPVIFPQFNLRGPDFSLPRHGFARHQPWERLDAVFAASALHGASAPAAALPAAHVPHDIVGTEDAAAAGLHAAGLVLGLHANEATRAAWSHDFSLQLHIRMLPGQLDLQLVLDNLDPQGCAPMHFTAALHTYFAVAELIASQVDGLAGSTRVDTLVQPNTQGPAGKGPLVLTGAIDDIYLGVQRPLVLQSGLGRLRIAMSGGFADTVVWNPGPVNAAAIDDMPDDDWRRMLCVEAACIGQPAELPPGGRWLAGQHLQVM
jgi:aldose 1-epimerase